MNLLNAVLRIIQLVVWFPFSLFLGKGSRRRKGD